MFIIHFYFSFLENLEAEGKREGGFSLLPRLGVVTLIRPWHRTRVGSQPWKFYCSIKIAPCQSPQRGMCFKVSYTPQSSQNMLVNKLYGLSSAVIDISPQVSARPAVEKIPLTERAPHLNGLLELLLSAGI